MKSPIDYVETLARALDCDDYETAAAVMADNVVYSIGDIVLHGREEIVASYREASAMARRLFDEVGYDHVVYPTEDPDTFRVAYSDILTVGGETLAHMAEQHVTVAPTAGVVQIVNVDVPGEREKVDDFLNRHGLSRN
jgi:erythromycin esterase-like protein